MDDVWRWLVVFLSASSAKVLLKSLPPSTVSSETRGIRTTKVVAGFIVCRSISNGPFDSTFFHIRRLQLRRPPLLRRKHIALLCSALNCSSCFSSSSLPPDHPVPSDTEHQRQSSTSQAASQSFIPSRSVSLSLSSRCVLSPFEDQKRCRFKDNGR